MRISFKRISIYLWEMYPPQHAVIGLALSAVFFMAQFRLHSLKIQMYPVLILAGISLTLSILLIRIMDEFKDYEDDLINFPARPLPSGRVTKGDLKFLGWSVVAILIIMNCWNVPLFVGQSAILVYSALMLFWFFMEKRMRASLPLAFISHHPIVYIYFIYLGLAFSITDKELLGWWMAIPLVFLSTNWELSRKIKVTENEYTTYSKIWGRRPAVFIAILCQFVSCLGVSLYLALLGVSNWLVFLFVFLWILLMFPYFRFFVQLKSRYSTLKIYAERLSFLALLTIILEVVFS